MADTAADILIDTVCDWGVEVIFGLPGTALTGSWKPAKAAG